MTSSSKKKKKKKADFQKVKLKAGRRLPKGLNVTNTAFKTRKIQIREQLRNDVGAAAFDHGKKILNLDDLLRNLNHQNTTARQNALNGLKDLFNSNKQIICKNLNMILSAIAKLFEDKSNDVRKSAQNVLDLILSSATSKQISPVFPIVAAYLNCGMTHVEPAIQRDSLKFLDVVLRHFPELLADSNPKILSNFLEQISRKTLNKSIAGRTLLVNLESRLTGQEWRLQVLTRVQKFIEAMVSNRTKLKRRNDVDARNISWNSNLVHVLVPHPESFLNEHFPSSGFSISNFNLNKGKQNIVEDSEELRKFMSSLVPLLIETWVEVRPERASNRNGRILTTDALATLNCLIEILKLILDAIESFNLDDRLVLNDFMKQIFEKEFFEYFMTSFPYVATTANNASKNGQKGKKKSQNPLQGGNLKVLSCNLNLLIVYIFVKLSPSSTGKEESWSTVIKYLIAVLQNPEYKVVAYDTKIMHDVLKTISTNSNFKDIGENLLSIALGCYKNENISIKKRHFLLELFSASILSSDQSAVRSPVLTEWLMLLPKELLNAKLFAQVIPIAQTMATMQNEAFLSGLQIEKSNILDLLPSIDASCNDSEKNCRGVIELLLHVKQFETCDYRTLTKYVRNEAISINLRCYCISILTLRYNRNAKSLSDTEASLFISFLLSLILEPSCESQLTGSYLPLRLRVFDADTNSWVSRERILKTVCISINEFENLNQLKDIFVEHVCSLLTSDYSCSLICSWSIVKFLKDMDLLDAVFSSAKDGFVEFLIATIYAELVYEKSVKTINLALENVLISYKIVSILGKLTRGIESVAQATTVCVVLSKLLQHWSPNNKYLVIIKDIGRHMKSRFGPAFTDSVGWNSLTYELQLKFESINEI